MSNYLPKISLIVDYYKLQKIFDFVSRVWLEPIKGPGPLPSSSERDMLLWILITWAFGRKEAFRHATKVAILRSSKDFDMIEGLPLPQAIVGRSKQQSQNCPN
jgi:hypothetical protein